MGNLHEIEHDLTRELLSIGLGKAADSLAALTQDKVMLQWFDIHLFKTNSFSEFPNNFDEDVCVLTTEVKGDLPGISYLLFSQTDAKAVTEQSIPESIKNSAGPEDILEMQNAILLELDNIVAASVVTQFSNLLNSKIYGDVPKIDYLNEKALTEFLIAKAGDFSLMLMAQVNFKGFNKNITPKFVWFFGPEFLNQIKVRLEDTENPMLLKNW
ncbi:MAG: hypothetical protein ACXITV_10750 [Luteibaculaceae bacterium]